MDSQPCVCTILLRHYGSEVRRHVGDSKNAVRLSGRSRGAGEGVQFYLLAGGRILTAAQSSSQHRRWKRCIRQIQSHIQERQVCGCKTERLLRQSRLVVVRSAYMGVNAAGEYSAESTTGGQGDCRSYSSWRAYRRRRDARHHAPRREDWRILHVLSGGGGALVQDAIAATQYGLEKANLSQAYSAKARADPTRPS